MDRKQNGDRPLGTADGGNSVRPASPADKVDALAERTRAQNALPVPERGTQSRGQTSAVCGLLLLAGVLVFGQSMRFGFVNYDDDDYVCNNPHVAQGVASQGVVWAFTQSMPATGIRLPGSRTWWTARSTA